MSNKITKTHIGNDIWKVGKLNFTKKDGVTKNHLVIYGPNRKEYHVWGNEVYKILGDNWGEWHSKIDPALLKIYILTHILDRYENWSSDFNINPNKTVKIIFSNGSVYHIEPDEFGKQKKILHKYNQFIKPIAWRIK